MSSYLVLARRWRPQRFADLVGQDVVVRTLKNALTSHSLAHAYLLTGIRGVGKTTIARLMAMASSCQNTNGDGEPCRTCDVCEAISSGSHLDVRELDAASHTGVDDMRDMLDDVRYPPVNLTYKVYIIDEAHMLSKSAFNALLKTLEEPPERVLFILATTESDKLPVTVRSRCQRFDLRRLGVQEIADYLAHVLNAESVSYEQEALLTIARSSDGSVRDALSLTERVLAFSKQHIIASDVRQSLGLIGPDIVQQLSDHIAQSAPLEAITLLRKAVMQGYASRQLLLALSEQWH
ncbi:MAG: DNA polymerase III subunit gamma/tau, partial [Mariprofundaceae bacterium]|nr:DNA polymerase III subunit gamma/tau [Mariprofundaceae bacterium]